MNTKDSLAKLAGRVSEAEVAVMYVIEKLKYNGHAKENIFNFEAGIKHRLIQFHKFDTDGEPMWTTTPKGHRCNASMQCATRTNFLH